MSRIYIIVHRKLRTGLSQRSAANFNLLTLYARTKDEREAAQAARFEEVRKLREEKAQEFLRMIEVRPYSVQ